MSDIYFHGGEVYYSKKENCFCQLRKTTDNGWMCSCAHYYNDARTITCIYPYSEEYIKKNFVKINNIADIADFNKDICAWRVKEI